MTLLDIIRQFLLGNKFTESTNDKGEITFTKSFDMPKQQVMINGRRVETPVEKKDFVITYLGQGTMHNVGEEDDELAGFNMANNDIWIESLDDFRFWLDRIFSN